MNYTNWFLISGQVSGWMVFNFSRHIGDEYQYLTWKVQCNDEKITVPLFFHSSGTEHATFVLQTVCPCSWEWRWRAIRRTVGKILIYMMAENCTGKERGRGWAAPRHYSTVKGAEFYILKSRAYTSNNLKILNLSK